ncbi:MAG: DUF4358 domain-containing protein [Ruminococcus sp.]|nr:DUF4358 domain-containing protein [Ruminococcus sp.]
MVLLRSIFVLTTAAAAVMIGMLLGGCSSENGGVSSVISEESVTAKDVLTQIDEELMDDSVFYGEEKFEKFCEKLYSVPSDEISDGGSIFSSGGGNADEISMIKTEDPQKGEEILHDRLQSRSSTFESYKPEEMQKINSAEIFSAGDYWVLIISDDAERLKEEIKELIQ